MKTIFIVESDTMLLKVYAEALSGEGRQVITFRTANLAVKALNKVVPDLVVLELALPVHNGFEFLYELRSYSDTRKTKVVVHSLLNPEEVNWEFVSMKDFGIHGYLYKPSTSLEQLNRQVRELL